MFIANLRLIQLNPKIQNESVKCGKQKNNCDDPKFILFPCVLGIVCVLK